MLKGKIQICFNKQREDSGTFYDANAIRCLTFRFREDGYYLGFLEKSVEINKYILFEEYSLDVIFPSINNDVLLQYKNQIENQIEIPICLGDKVIGRGSLLEWEIKDDFL